MPDRPLILVVDDELPIRRFVAAALAAEGYRVEEAASGEELVARATTSPPDAVVLDLGLPDGDGMQWIDWLRGWSRAPILVLSARGLERDKVTALDRGADDYLTKPFATGELKARLRVALRNRALGSSDSADPVFRVGELRVDREHRRVYVGAETVALTPLEYRLLLTFVAHAGKVLTHRFLLSEVWGPAHSDDPRYVRVFVAALRRKIEPNPTRPRYLLTEQGVGYRFADE